MRRRSRNRARAVLTTGGEGTPHGHVPSGHPDPLLERYQDKALPVPPRDALLAALRDADTALRVCPTGSCHTCDRPVTGERIYCGPCAARR